MDDADTGRGAVTATEPSCRACGAGLLARARFCDQCGAPVTGFGGSAEYKQVTVLFADVVGSMDIAAAVGAERLREIMAKLANGCAAVVKRYGCTIDQFTGDGIMAVFGAPVALEDHAFRACLAALGIQEHAKRLAAEVRTRDGVELRLRVGLNSGQVVGGDMASGPFGYTAVGEQVGMAQRMESVAPPGGVMLSAATARLVDGAAVLDQPQLSQIKGAAEPVAAYRLLGIEPQRRIVGRMESTLVGRQREMSAVQALLDRAVAGRGAVVGVVGPPGIGKSRLVREIAAMGRCRGTDVFSVYCESHTSEVPFHAIAKLVRSATGIEALHDQQARDLIRDRNPGADAGDLALLYDLLGIADPNAPAPNIDPDARRRRLTALVNNASLARATPVVYVIEDAHWIDEISESMLAGFLTVILQTPALVLVSYRPEYQGVLSRQVGAQTMALAPLNNSESAALVSELVGRDPSVGALCETIATRAAGNPFFAEEIVRELADRGVLSGHHGAYVSSADAGQVSVPATVQATIAARIDRLEPKAKRTLNAAAVVGSRFESDMLTKLGIEPVVGDLLAAELIDQVGFSRTPEYAFHHPLIHAVTYESQLKSDRAGLHQRVAGAIETRGTPDADAALIAEHLEAAGNSYAAYGWHMRAAMWATNRDIAAARLSWERAQTIADALPGDNPDRTAMRIAPRTMLCGTSFRAHVTVTDDRFNELRELCTAIGDKASLAIAMAGLVIDHAHQGRMRKASQLASEVMALIASLGDPTLTMGLSFAAIYAKMQSAEMDDVLRWSQKVIDLADGDPAKGNIIIGSPLAAAFATRAIARYALGRPGWRDDLQQALTLARSADPMSYARVVTYAYLVGIPAGVLRPNDRVLREIEDALRIAERSGDDHALSNAQITLGLALVHRPTDAEHARGQKLLAEVSDQFLRRGYFQGDLLLIVHIYLARERARCGDRDEALPLMRDAVDHLLREGVGSAAPVVLVETLLDRGTRADVAEADAAIERLTPAPAGEGLVLRAIWLLRVRALRARAHGDDTAYRDYRDRYRALATTLGYEGHLDWAQAMR
ncbi:adenylate/guanylate cyclase domain-containing protein [Mycobacterium sp. OTB74]|uniref:ATP-binding protein n=1 Tax=Mycobacterium sp. OTB74 TaxID=1853452 RepID=UPI002474E270|nr:adenylate/guanylate cyclase domain-containing protein [Mycobacterium sp. OTB74]MDH6245732.1 class 3 adenylate cyclase [Mycobacterium sp. OTB74]